MDDIQQKQRSLSNEQRKKLAAIKIPMEVSPYEMETVKRMRAFSHGRLTIQFLDDIPVRFIEEKSTMVIEGTDALETLEQVRKAI